MPRYLRAHRTIEGPTGTAATDTRPRPGPGAYMHLLAGVLLLGLASISAAQETRAGSPAIDLVAQGGPATPGAPAAADPGYVGGLGLITRELATGLFLNPTSGTLAEHAFTLQYCAVIFHVGHDTGVDHRTVVGFGITDWLEVGAGGILSDPAGGGGNPKVGGPLVRVRLLKEERWQPEVSVGGVFLFGDDGVFGGNKYTFYAAASKGLKISDTGFIRSVRGHVGVRNSIIENAPDGHFGFIGGEIELPKHVFLVAEVANRSEGFTKTPWAVGIQVRHPDGFGFSLALAQWENFTNPAVYVGVGINFQ